MTAPLPHRLAILTAVAATLSGCASTEIVRKSGCQVSGEIASATRDEVYVNLKGTEQVVVIPRDDILTVRHPGARGAIGGSVAAAVGLPFIPIGAAMMGDTQPTNRALGAQYLTTGTTLVIGGLATGFFSYYRYTRSKKRYALPPRAQPSEQEED